MKIGYQDKGMSPFYLVRFKFIVPDNKIMRVMIDYNNADYYKQNYCHCTIKKYHIQILSNSFLPDKKPSKYIIAENKSFYG